MHLWWNTQYIHIDHHHANCSAYRLNMWWAYQTVNIYDWKRLQPTAGVWASTIVFQATVYVWGTVFFLAFLWYSRYWWDSVFFFLFPALNPVMNGNLNGSILEINVNLFSFSLTVPQDTGIVTTATLCYLFSNHASAYFLSLYTFYYFIFITDMFLFIHDCCFRHKSHDRCYCPLEMI